MYYIVLTYVYAPRFARDGQHIITTMNVNFVRLVLCSTNIILMHASHIYVYIYRKSGDRTRNKKQQIQTYHEYIKHQLKHVIGNL